MNKKAGNVARRFWRLVQIWSDADMCWPWQGGFFPTGYGKFRGADGTTLYAHRVAYELENGPIPEGQRVLHSCDNRPCCNPKHLFAGTQQDNVDDMIAKGRAGWQTNREGYVERAKEARKDNGRHTF